MNVRFSRGALILSVTALISNVAFGDIAQDVAAYDGILAGVREGQSIVLLGDMIVPVATVRLWRDRLANTGKPIADSASQTGINRWPGGIVHYVFNTSPGSAVSAAHQTATRDAMAEWATFAALTFSEGASANYILISDGGGEFSGGTSAVGMVGGAQPLNIGSMSWNRGTILHELGHALGLIHEHQRGDGVNSRDNFVTINFSNVPGGTSNGNFILVPTSTSNGPYDFLSVMHYARNAFSTSLASPPADTIVPKSAYLRFINVMGNNPDRILSRGDRDGMAAMYGAGPAISTVVTNTRDSGPGSLRTAIYKAFDIATDTPGAMPTVTFQIPITDPDFNGSVFTITPTDRLPGPGPGTTIDATTQTAFTGNTNPGGPEVVLNGSQQPPLNPYGMGLRLSAANVTVKSLAIVGCANQGILITTGATGSTVAGCDIGISATGTSSSANAFAGIEISGGATGNRVGGTTANDRNVISGNSSQGILIRDSGTTGNTVIGNWIGLNAAGSGSVGNVLAGIEISGGAQGNVIGGTTAGTRNVISGNTIQGVFLNTAGTSGNFVSGNYIGTNPAGTAAIANGAAGVEIAGTATANTIGGAAAGAGNLLSGNGTQGVKIGGIGTTGNVVAGNLIGLNYAGTGALPNVSSGVGIFGGATFNTIGGPAAGNIISGNTIQGIYITGSGTNSNTVAGNWIGLNGSGTARLSNGAAGIEISAGPQGNIVGGATTAARNVISGNAVQGVFIAYAGTSVNVVSGNYIGTNPDGTVAIANVASGVEIYFGAAGNTIGGATPGAGNVISGNSGPNVLIDYLGANNNVVSGNWIGLNAAGTAALVNGAPGVQIWGGAQGNTIGGISGGRNFIAGNNGAGVTISDSGTNLNVIVGNSIGGTPAGTVVANAAEGIALFGGPQGNTIGGTSPGAANIISGNGTSGVALYNAGTINNRVSGNSITANGGLGIYLDGFGANNSQSAPSLTSAVLGLGSTVNGSLNSTANTTFRIEFFANTTGDGEGQNFIGAISVTTDGSGNATFAPTLPAIVPAGRNITATATDPAGNTSKFSQNVTVTTIDTDGDGLPDVYENANSLSTTIADANIDSDGDGMTNAQEFRAGTDPRNASSVFRLAAPGIAGADITLSLGGMAGRTYRVEFTDSLEAPVRWRILADQIPGASTPIPLLDPGAAALPRRFYRATVEP